MSICAGCKQIIASSEQFVVCEAACVSKLHTICANLSAAEMKILEYNKNIAWQCDGCLAKAQAFAKGGDGAIANNQQADAAASSYQKQPYKFIFNHKTMIGALTIVMVLSLIGVILCETGLLSMMGAQSLWKAQNSTIDNLDYGNSSALTVVNRTEWQARPARSELIKLQLPVSRVIISHTISDFCYNQDDCSFRIQVIQSFHMDSWGWDDIGIHFLVGGDGRVYVGRGWYNQGAHTKGYNADSYGIAFIGTFTTQEPTQQQLMAAKLLIEEGVRLQNIVPNYRLYGTRQFSASESPGEALFKIIKTWPQFTDDLGDSNSGALKVVNRTEWQARPARAELTKLQLPISRVIISHSTSSRCFTQEVCSFRMQVMQKLHMDTLGFDDIGYNFLIGGDGLVYEGRGWYNQGAHTKGYNADSYGISLIGTFTTEKPTQQQLMATELLIEEGVRLRNIVPNYRLYGTRQFSASESSGEALFKIIKTWPQFTETVENVGKSAPPHLRLVNRDAWLAQQPSNALVALDLPVSNIIVLPTNTEMCTTQAACTFRVRSIQTYNIESLQHDDIIYNFLIGGDGNVYEGRGWNNEGAHLKGFNDNSISFAYIGTFKLQNPTDKQMNVTKLLLEEGMRLGKLAPDYKIYSANSLDPTQTTTSASALYASFKSLPHWFENSTLFT